MGTAYVLLIFGKYLGPWSLWGSLFILVASSLYYSVTFFHTDSPFDKLYFFMATLLAIISYFALVYYAFGIIDTSTGDVVKKDWHEAFYFSVVTWTTLGYGDYRPSDILKPWAMVEALLGYIFMALLVGKFIYYASQRTRGISVVDTDDSTKNQ